MHQQHRRPALCSCATMALEGGCSYRTSEQVMQALMMPAAPEKQLQVDSRFTHIAVRALGSQLIVLVQGITSSHL